MFKFANGMKITSDTFTLLGDVVPLEEPAIRVLAENGLWSEGTDGWTAREDAVSKVNFHVLSKNFSPCLLSQFYGQITQGS